MNDTLTDSCRRGAPRQECRRAACLIASRSFQYAQLLDVSEHGASFLTDGEARFGEEVQVIIELPGRRALRASFRPAWRRGDRVGGAWSRVPLPEPLWQQLCDTAQP